MRTHEMNVPSDPKKVLKSGTAGLVGVLVTMEYLAIPSLLHCSFMIGLASWERERGKAAWGDIAEVGNVLLSDWLWQRRHRCNEEMQT